MGIRPSFRWGWSGLALCFPLLLGLPIAASMAEERDHGMFRRLTNGVVTIDILDPKASHPFTASGRFSPVAFILQAELEGRTFFFPSPEDLPALDGGGLPMEFDILTKGGPPGFAEAAVGEGFLKIGVGILRKSEAHYRFENPQIILDPATTLVRWEKDGATFEQDCKGINGYAYFLSAAVSLERTTIRMTHVLRNTGKKPFTTENYVHNFFRFDGQPPGPGYEIRFPYMIITLPPSPLRLVDPQTLGFAARPTGPVNANFPYPKDFDGPNILSVRCKTNGMQIDLETSVAGTRTFLHLRPETLCPEQFIRWTLAPGEEVRWTRLWTLKVR